MFADAAVMIHLFLVTATVTSAVQVEEVRLAGGGMADRGRLEVKMGGQWGTVCDDKWDHQDARVVCRMLGQSGGVAYANAYFGAGSGTILLDVVGCSGDEGNLNMCTLALNDPAFSSCGHYEDAGVRCGMDPPNHAASFLQATENSPLRSNCPNDTGRSPNVRLVGSGQTTSSGLVQARNPQQGVNQFGYVCDDNWNINNAKVVCRELCYDPKEAQPGWHKPAGTQMPSSPQIVLDMVQCEGTERALADCLHQPWYVHDCSPSELAAVTCGVTPSEGNVVPKAEVDCQADKMVVTFNKADNPSLKTAFIVTVPPTPSTCILDKKEDTLQIQVTLTYYDCALLSQSQQGFKLNLTFVSALLIPLVRSSSPTNGMSRIIEYRVDVKCNMPGEYSASRRLPNVDQPALPASGDMSLQIEMMMYLDDTFSTPVNGQKMVLTQGGWVNLGVRLNTLDQRVKLVVTSCYAGPDLSDPTKPRQALLLNKCIQEDSVSIYPINDKFWGLRFQPFSFDNFTDVTIECDAYACKTGQVTGKPFELMWRIDVNLRTFLLNCHKDEQEAQKEINPDVFTKEPYCLVEAVHFLEMELTVMRRNIVDALHATGSCDRSCNPSINKHKNLPVKRRRRRRGIRNLQNEITRSSRDNLSAHPGQSAKSSHGKTPETTTDATTKPSFSDGRKLSFSEISVTKVEERIVKHGTRGNFRQSGASTQRKTELDQPKDENQNEQGGIQLKFVASGSDNIGPQPLREAASEAKQKWKQGFLFARLTVAFSKRKNNTRI